MKHFNTIVLGGLGILLLTVVAMLFILIPKAHASQDYPDVMGTTSIRPKASEAYAEPITTIDRYNERDLRNDEAVLVSLPRDIRHEQSVVIDRQKVAMAHRIDQLERENLTYKAQTLTGTMELE